MYDTYTLEVERDYTIDQIINKIMIKHNIKCPKKLLALRKITDKIMDNDKTLLHYDITGGSTLRLTGWAYVNADEDTYPVPLMSNVIPSRKVKDNDRLLYSTMYLCNNRTKELLDEIDISKVKDNYGDDIIQLACWNYGGFGYNNVLYIDNIKIFGERLLVILNNTPKWKLKEIFDDYSNNIVDRPIIRITKQLCGSIDKSYYLIALWNYGLQFDEECLKHINGIKLKIH